MFGSLQQLFSGQAQAHLWQSFVEISHAAGLQVLLHTRQHQHMFLITILGSAFYNCLLVLDAYASSQPP